MTKTLIAAALAAVALTATIAASALAAPQAQTIRVTERDYRIGLSAPPKAGRVTFVVRNAGEDAHDFLVRGGGKTFRTRGIAPGGSARLTATLKRGVRYQFWCSVGSHAKKGMRGSFVAR
jgi:plastocyanin